MDVFALIFRQVVTEINYTKKQPIWLIYFESVWKDEDTSRNSNMTAVNEYFNRSL